MSLLVFGRVGKEEELKNDLSACGGLSYDLTEEVKVFSTVGRFVGYPTLMDRYWQPFSLSLQDTVGDYLEEGNRDLETRRALSTDLGVRAERGNLRMSGYVFRSEIDDMTIWSDVDTTVRYGHFRPANTEALIWGANLNLEAELLDHLSWYVSYSFKRGQDSDRNTRLPCSPEHSLFAFIQFEEEFLRKEIDVKLRVETRVLSERFMDQVEGDEEPAVAVINGKLTVRFLDFHFHYAVRNITDRRYRLTRSYSVPERTFWWGFYWEFFD